MATDDERRVTIPPVRTFETSVANKAQALKPLEEAAEVYGAWQDLRACARVCAGIPADELYTRESETLFRLGSSRNGHLIEECCDVIQATCNPLAALGVTDLTEAMADCERRNEERGRYGDR